jgi:hypothetical protein
MSDFVFLDGWLLSEDGTLNEHTTNGTRGMAKHPPDDPHELSKLKVMYWEKKLALAVEEFDTRKRSLISTAQNSLMESQQTGQCAGPPMEEADAVRLLNGLRQKAKSCQRELTKWQKQRDETEPIAFQNARALAEESRGALASFCQKLSAIEI